MKLILLFAIFFIGTSTLYSQKSEKVDKQEFQKEKLRPTKVAAPPPAPEEMEEEVFAVVEEMPRFPGCEDKTTKEEKEKCSNQKMFEYISENLQYPELAKENGVEGRVVLSFLITKSGRIENIEVVEGIGYGTEEAAINVIEGMNQLEPWIPGKQRGEPKIVTYTLPIYFQLPVEKK